MGRQAAAPTPDEGANPGESKLGIVVRDAPPEMVAKIHHPGVVVQSVRTGSFADLSSLEPGLVIIRINKQATGNRDQFNAVVGKLKVGDDVGFEVVGPRPPHHRIRYLGGTLQEL